MLMHQSVCCVFQEQCFMFDASKCLLCVSGAVLHVRCIKVFVVCFRSGAPCSMHQSVCCVFQEQCFMFNASKCLLCVSGAVLHVRCIKVSVVCFRSSARCSMYKSVFSVFQEHAVNSEHIWMDTNASGDFCYAMEQDCIVSLEFFWTK